MSESSPISLFSNMSSSSCLSSCLDDILLNLGGTSLAVETPSYYRDALVAYGPLGSLFYLLLLKAAAKDFDPWGTFKNGPTVIFLLKSSIGLLEHNHSFGSNTKPEAETHSQLKLKWSLCIRIRFRTSMAIISTIFH